MALENIGVIKEYVDAIRNFGNVDAESGTYELFAEYGTYMVIGVVMAAIVTAFLLWFTWRKLSDEV